MSRNDSYVFGCCTWWSGYSDIVVLDFGKDGMAVSRMSERKYTDEEIVKALAIHSDKENPCVGLCPYSETPYCGSDMARDALDLINRQKAEVDKLQEVNADLNESLRLAAEANKDLMAEIERLRSMNQSKLDIIHDLRADLETERAEAIKEFAERLKANMCHGYIYLEIEEDLFRRDIDNLVAEMTEGK